MIEFVRFTPRTYKNCKPPFFEQLHEQEKNNARNNPPGALCRDAMPSYDGGGDGDGGGGSGGCGTASSSHKRSRNDSGAVLRELDRAAAARHAALQQQLKKGSKEKKRLVDIVEK